MIFYDYADYQSAIFDVPPVRLVVGSFSGAAHPNAPHEHVVATRGDNFACDVVFAKKFKAGVAARNVWHNYLLIEWLTM
jgi:hypothetical protein